MSHYVYRNSTFIAKILEFQLQIYLHTKLHWGYFFVIFFRLLCISDSCRNFMAEFNDQQSGFLLLLLS